MEIIIFICKISYSLPNWFILYMHHALCYNQVIFCCFEKIFHAVVSHLKLKLMWNFLYQLHQSKCKRFLQKETCTYCIAFIFFLCSIPVESEKVIFLCRTLTDFILIFIYTYSRVCWTIPFLCRLSGTLSFLMFRVNSWSDCGAIGGMGVHGVRGHAIGA